MQLMRSSITPPQTITDNARISNTGRRPPAPGAAGAAGAAAQSHIQAARSAALMESPLGIPASDCVFEQVLRPYGPHGRLHTPRTSLLPYVDPT